MKNILYISIILCAGTAVGFYLSNEPGVAAFTYRDWLIQMPLWLAFILMVITVLAGYYIVKLTHYLTHFGQHFNAWRNRRRTDSARQKTIQGLIELMEGRWTQAEQLLANAINHDTSLINHLFAARAAQEQGEYQRRDEYLRLAHANHPKADIAVSLTQAQLQLEHNQFEHALATLMHIQQVAPKHKTALKLLKKLYYKLHDWDSLLKLLPTLVKQQVIKQNEAEALEKNCYQSLIQIYIDDTKSVDDLFELWRKAPSRIVKQADILADYCKILIKRNQHQEAEVRLREALKLHWDSKLVKLYGKIMLPEKAKQLTTAERWLESHPNDPALLLTLGKICIHNQLWGKAKDYLEASLNITPSAEAYHAIGQLLDELGEHNQSSKYYREGFMLANFEV